MINLRRSNSVFARKSDFAVLPLRFTLSATGSPTLLPAAWPYPKAWNPVVVLEEDARPRKSSWMAMGRWY